MSFYRNGEQDMHIHLMKQRHMHSILLYNRQTVEQKRKQHEADISTRQQHHKHSEILSSQELLDDARNKRQHRLLERETLRNTYETQIEEKRKKILRDQQQDKMYAKMLRDQLEFDQMRRRAEQERIFNRHGYSVIPGDSVPERRYKTEPAEDGFQRKVSYGKATIDDPERREGGLKEKQEFKGFKDSLQGLEDNFSFSGKKQY